MSILITICARGGSKGVPGKNIRPIAGKPLIAHTIAHARAFQERFSETDIQLSTDDDTIREVAEKYDLTTHYKRPQELGSDSTGKVAVIRDALAFAETDGQTRYDFILDLDVTSPLRILDDLIRGYEQIQRSDKLILFSVNESHKNPYFNMVEFDGKDYKISKDSQGFMSRQDLPKVYDMNASFYFYRREFFESNLQRVTEKGIFDVYVMDHVCHDIDTELDLEFVKFLIENGKLFS